MLLNGSSLFEEFQSFCRKWNFPGNVKEHGKPTKCVFAVDKIYLGKRGNTLRWENVNYG